jgi:hypothetical protein
LEEAIERLLSVSESLAMTVVAATVVVRVAVVAATVAICPDRHQNPIPIPDILTT